MRMSATSLKEKVLLGGGGGGEEECALSIVFQQLADIRVSRCTRTQAVETSWKTVDSKEFTSRQ